MERRELTLNSVVVSIGPQVFDLLLFLIKNRDRVVSKDELLASVWGNRIVSDSTITSHINAVRNAIGDSGQNQIYVKTIARKGFRFIGDLSSTSEVPSDLSTAQIEVPKPSNTNEFQGSDNAAIGKPSICVLPFHNLGGNSEEEYFIDGLVKEIIVGISRIDWLFVIASNSSFIYKNRTIDVAQIRKDLGVRYIVEGSFRKLGEQVRLTGQLIDANTGQYIWAERFEGSFNDIFALQDQLAESVIGAILPQLEQAEIERAKSKSTESLDAYDCYLRGIAKLNQGTREANDAALSMFNKAIELDSEYACAYGMSAWCYFWRKVNGWLIDPEQEIEKGVKLANKAIELGRNDAIALTRGGHVLGHLVGDLDGGIALIDRALLLNPNLASAWYLGGFLRVFKGEIDSAIDFFMHASRLSPMDPEMFRIHIGMSFAHFFSKRFEESAEYAEKAIRSLHTSLPANALLVASKALNGQIDQARTDMQVLLRLAPALKVTTITDWLPIHSIANLNLFAEGLRLAGLPEK